MTQNTTESWQSVIDNPNLRDLPYKIERNQWGQLIMSPTHNNHSDFQEEIQALLRQQKTSGRVIPECTIATSKGEKVVDVAWASTNFRQAHKHEAAYSAAPELCVEVRSPNNSWAEMTEKIALYLEKGAIEVWICQVSGESGQMRFFGAGGEMAQSLLFPSFPGQLSIED
jgi:Uma2 family endonuclease